jgi:hypothetical protein
MCARRRTCLARYGVKKAGMKKRETSMICTRLSLQQSTVMPRAGLEPARPYDQRIFLPLRLSPPVISLWSGRCLLHASEAMFRREPSRLYTLLVITASTSLSSALPSVISRANPVKVSPTLTPFTQAFPSHVLKHLSPSRLPFRHPGTRAKR